MQTFKEIFAALDALNVYYEFDFHYDDIQKWTATLTIKALPTDGAGTVWESGNHDSAKAAAANVTESVLRNYRG